MRHRIRANQTIVEISPENPNFFRVSDISIIKESIVLPPLQMLFKYGVSSVVHQRENLDTFLLILKVLSGEILC